MKLGLDVSQIVYKGTGVGRFTEGLVKAILDYDQTNKWTFFFSGFRLKLDPRIKQTINQKGHALIEWNLPPSLLSLLWNDYHNLAKNLQINLTELNSLDWFITSDWTEPPLTCKKTTIVHDLVFMRYPETVNKSIIQVQKKRFGWLQKETSLIFADSQSTKDDLISFFSFSEDKIIVNYPGVEVKQVGNTVTQNLFKKYSIDGPFILTVGKIEPRKNLSRLIEAYRQIETNIKLIVVGPEGWGNLETKHDPRIQYTGYVSDDELTALYSSALFFIFPSIWEGFGFPAVEAMRLGCPVALSDTSSLKEIGENVACFFDPFNVEAIKSAIEKMIHDGEYRNEIKQKGLTKSTDFNWKTYYNKLIQSLGNNVISNY